MKRFLLSLFTLSIFSLYNAQCTPDPLYADSAWGIWPDEQTNLMPGDIGVIYNQVVNFKVPYDAGAIDTAYTGQYIDSIILNNVTGLPPGLTYTCNNSNCTWYADSAGCASIDGTPTTNGSYQINLDVTAWTTIFFNPFPVDYPYDGYIINIGPVGISSYQMTNNTLKLEQSIPNPANQSTSIQYVSGTSCSVDFHMTNLLGETIHQFAVNSNRGVNNIEINTSLLPDGIYLYSISNGLMKQTKRLIVNH